MEVGVQLFISLISPHYRSEGRRQGSCGVFGGVFLLSRLLILILLWSTYLAELVLNFIKFETLYNKATEMLCISSGEKQLKSLYNKTT